MRAPAPDEAWIGLGTNLGDRAANLRAALASFGDDVVQASPVYETAPWGIVDQPWFLNQVARIRWTGGAAALVDRCLAVEREMGRVRRERNGPRLIDLDVLVCGTEVVREHDLSVPHPGIANRRSVLEPWADVAPELVVPGMTSTLSELRAAAARELTDQALRPASPR